MNLYRIYFYLVCFSSPLCWWVDKKEKKIERVYIYMFYFCLCIYVYVCLIFYLWAFIEYLYVFAMHELRGAPMKLIFNPYLYNSMSFVIIKKEEKNLEFIYTCLSLFMHICLFSLCASLNIFIVFAMHELRGSFYEAYL